MKSFLALLLVVLAISTVDAKKRAANIVGGSNATAGQFPFMVSLSIGDGLGSSGRCGGFIIDEYHVGTAAHCFDPNTLASNVQAIAGTIDISGSAGQTRTASSFVIHPQYDTVTSLYDAALITLSEPLVLDGVNTKAITLASGLPTVGTAVYGAGWGTTSSGGNTVDYLLWVSLPYQSIATCDAVYDPLTVDIQICAGGDAGKDTCQGDSGGPLFTATDPANPTDATVIGIVSFGTGCGTNPGVYADVPGFAKAYFEGIIATSASGVPSSVAVAASSGAVAASSVVVAASSGAVAASSVPVIVGTQSNTPIIPPAVDGSTAVCGNGVVEAGEVCDAGSAVPRTKCCSAYCDNLAVGATCGPAPTLCTRRPKCRASLDSRSLVCVPGVAKEVGTRCGGLFSKKTCQADGSCARSTV